MSPLWRDQIEVFFAPGRLDLVRTGRGLKPVRSPVITQLIHDIHEGEPVWLQPGSARALSSSTTSGLAALRLGLLACI